MNNSQNVKGNKNKVTNNQFHFFNPHQEPNITPYDKAPVTVCNKQVKTSWFFIGAFVSFAANIATIYTSFKNFTALTEPSILLLGLSGISSFLFIFFYLLFSNARLFKFLGISIADYNGSLFFEKYRGTCPCGGKLRFFQSFQTGKGYAQCLANDGHLFEFSPKSFNKENYAPI